MPLRFLCSVAPLLPTAALALVAASGCGKKPEAYRLEGDVYDYRDAKLIVRGKTVPFVPSEPKVMFGPGEIDEKEPVIIEYATTCGTEKVKVTPDGPADKYGVVKLRLPPPKNIAKLLFDPKLAGKEIAQPKVKVPAPEDPISHEDFVKVAFGDCPRTIQLDGRTIAIPDKAPPGKALHYVLVGTGKDACYLSGTALYGVLSGRCEPESSEKLTGQDAYAITREPMFIFKPVDDKALTTSPTSDCTNRDYLQHCQ
jgi:hypothetical protein